MTSTSSLVARPDGRVVFKIEGEERNGRQASIENFQKAAKQWGQ